MKTYPKLTDKKFPLVSLERTDWAAAPFPMMTRTSVPAATNTPSHSQSDQRKDQVTKLTQKLGQELADSAALDPAATLPRHPVSVPLLSSPLLSSPLPSRLQNSHRVRLSANFELKGKSSGSKNYFNLLTSTQISSPFHFVSDILYYIDIYRH